MSAIILPFRGRRVKCANCLKWFLRVIHGTEKSYCSYVCGATAQPEYCASSWAFTSTPGDTA